MCNIKESPVTALSNFHTVAVPFPTYLSASYIIHSQNKRKYEGVNFPQSIADVMTESHRKKREDISSSEV